MESSLPLFSLSPQYPAFFPSSSFLHHPYSKHIWGIHSIKSLSAPAGSWVKGQWSSGERKRFEEELELVATSDPAFRLPAPSPTPCPQAPTSSLPTIFNDTRWWWSITPSSKRDALKHHCGREGSIRFFFFKMIMKTCGLNVSLYAVLLGGLSLLAWTSSAAWKGWRVLVILLSLHFVLP